MTASAAEPIRFDRQDAAACAALAAVALVVRLIGLNGGLWLDEINGLIDWMRPPFHEILTVWKGDGQHPLYALLAHGSMVLFGEQPWSVRLPAALFGVATVPLLYAFARLVGSRREAWLAAALLAVSYHHTWFSQNARGYTALTFFVLLATYCLVRGLETWRTRWFVAWSAAIALGAYTHLTVVFPAFAHFLVVMTVLLGSRTPAGTARWRPVLTGFGLAGTLTLALYTPIVQQVVWWFLHRPSNFEGISTPAWALGEAVRVLRQGIAGGAGAVIGVAALAAGGAILLSGAISFFRTSRAVLALCTLPALVTFAGAFVVRGTMYPRFFFYVLPYVVLIAVRGAVQLPAHVMAWRRRAGAPTGVRAGTALALLMIAASALSLPFNYRFPKQDFAGALAFVETHRRTDEPILVVGATVGPYQRYFGRDWPAVETVAGLDSITAGQAGYWLVYTLPRYIQARTPDLLARIRAECTAPDVFRGTVGGGDIVVCRVTKGLDPS